MFLDWHVNQFRHACQAKRAHRPRAQALLQLLLHFTFYPNSDVVLTRAVHFRTHRERMELVQTDIRADSHDSESKISDEVEANVSLRRRARWPKGRIECSLVL